MALHEIVHYRSTTLSSDAAHPLRRDPPSAQRSLAVAASHDGAVAPADRSGGVQRALDVPPRLIAVTRAH
jgi:hypothetical protein